MSKLSDEQLLKRAYHAGRSLFVLACLATFGAVAMGAVAILAPPPAKFLFGAGAVLVFILALGYWFLSVAARRGSATAVGVILVVLFASMTFSLVAEGVAAARSGGSADINIGRFIIPGVVAAVLIGNRKVLLELKKRGLWDQAFPMARPTGTLVVIGGILVATGIASLSVATLYASARAAQAQTQEAGQAQAFAHMISSDERRFLESLERLGTGGDPAETRASLEALAERIRELRAASKDQPTMLSILSTYERTVDLWKTALHEIESTNPNATKADQSFKLADRLRQEAFDQFDRRYASGSR